MVNGAYLNRNDIIISHCRVLHPKLIRCKLLRSSILNHRKTGEVGTSKVVKLLLSRRAWAAIFLLNTLLLFGCASTPSNYPKEEETPVYGPPEEIRILTINVWSGLTYRGFFKMGEYEHYPEKRYELLLSEIRRLAPDVVTIQEANPLPRYAKRLAKDLDYEFIYHVALGGIRFGAFGIPTNMREGQAILVKKLWTIKELGRKRLSGGGIVTNWFSFHFHEITQTLLGRVVINGKPLYIYNVHLHEGPFKGPVLENVLIRLSQEMTKEKVEKAKKAAEKDIERRRVEINNLTKFVEETLPPRMPAIMLGDFNTTVESGELEPLLSGGKWVDNFRFKNPKEEGVTWDPQYNPNYRSAETIKDPCSTLHAYHGSHSYRIDFIFVNSDIPRDHILESRVVLTTVDGFSPSDHYGVLTILKW
jgi:endonuclease/exonuclease/phosphatase family metal-dependent hydrolase